MCQVSVAEEVDLQLLKHCQRALAGSEMSDLVIGMLTLFCLLIFSEVKHD